MAKTLSSERFNRIAKATGEQIRIWKEGVSIERDSNETIDRLLLLTAASRWRLATLSRAHANQLTIASPARYRSAVSRYYYAMYHAMRACVFLYNNGDDFQEHSELPKHIPDDFPSKSLWQTRLKDARLSRNNADYDPYPRSEKAWKKPAFSLGTDADLLLKETRAYLKKKGCPL